MRDDQDRDDLLDELKQKLELVEERVDEIEESSDEEGGDEDNVDLGELELNLPFRVHWVFIEDTAESACVNIDTVVKAQNAFLIYAHSADDSSSKYDVNSGDLLVLMCNHSSTSPIDPDDENSNHKFDDACYYVGMCVSSRLAGQEIISHDNFPQLGASFVGGGEKKILVWDTCGGSESAETEGHTGDVIESRLGAPTLESTYCSGDYTVVTLEFPKYEKTLEFEDGLLKEVSDETQNGSVSSTFSLPCCCDSNSNCSDATASDFPFTKLERYDISGGSESLIDTYEWSNSVVQGAIVRMTSLEKTDNGVVTQLNEGDPDFKQYFINNKKNEYDVCEIHFRTGVSAAEKPISVIVNGGWDSGNTRFKVS